MPNRKQTPDVLGAVLGDPTPTTDIPAPAKTTSPKKKTSTRKNPPRNTKTKVPQSRQWEYQIVNFQDYRGWKPRFVNGEEVSGWKQLPDMPVYINQLGAEGWEMSGASNAGRNQLQVFFKRQKTNM